MPQIQLSGLTFNLYGLVLGVAILASLQASLWLAKKRKIETGVIEGLFWWTVVGGIIGARAYHVIDKWREIYSLNPLGVFYIWNGGLGIWGAIVGGIVGLWLGKGFLDFARNDRVRGLRSMDLLDIALFGLPLGQAIGRWGNFFNNEIVGRNGEPLFFYESILDFVLFGILVLLVKRDSSTSVGMTRKGTIAGIYLVGYGLIRLFLESFRLPDDQWLIGGVSMATILAIGAVLAGAYFVWKDFKRRLI